MKQRYFFNRLSNVETLGMGLAFKQLETLPGIYVEVAKPRNIIHGKEKRKFRKVLRELANLISDKLCLNPNKEIEFPTSVYVSGHLLMLSVSIYDRFFGNFLGKYYVVWHKYSDVIILERELDIAWLKARKRGMM